MLSDGLFFFGSREYAVEDAGYGENGHNGERPDRREGTEQKVLGVGSWMLGGGDSEGDVHT